MKTSWNLKLLYTSPDDPNIERDMRTMERAYASFAKTYAGRTDYLKDEQKLRDALCAYEELTDTVGGGKPLTYFWFKSELNSADTESQARLNVFRERLTKAGNTILFFELALGTIPEKKRGLYLKSTHLKDYRYFLERIFETSKHNLSEPEEKILSLKSLTSRSLWIEGLERELNKQTVQFKGKPIPIAEAMNTISTLPTTARRKLSAEVMLNLKGISGFAESEINAIVLDKKINDELRGFQNPWSATVLGYENDEKSVLNLVDAVSGQFALSNRFYTLKKKLLGLPELTYADRAVSLGKTKKEIPFREAVEILRSVFYDTGTEYGKILDRFTSSGQVDVFPKRGKTSGAFCAGTLNLPTYVLLNYVNDFNSVLTFAHEMGHAIHTERSKTQPVLYQGYTTSVAETASTLFEGIVFSAVFETLTEKEKVIALHDKIQDDIQTIFRQVAFFNFERDLHQVIREKGNLPKEDIAALLNRHMRSYLGPAVTLEGNDGYFFVAVSHFRRFFYVYSYAYGQLISKALGERLKADPAYIEEIDRFLTAGGSMLPEQIFSRIGIDTMAKDFFTTGLASIEQDIDRLAALTKKVV